MYCLLRGILFSPCKLKLCKISTEATSFSVAENCWVLHEPFCSLPAFEKPAKEGSLYDS